MIKIDDKVYFKKNMRFNKRAFLRTIGIRRKGYMSRVATRLFEYYFANSISLRKEYRKYYRKEFHSYELFLSQRHNLFNPEIELLKTGRGYYKDLSTSADPHISDLMEDESIRDAVLLFVEVNAF